MTKGTIIFSLYDVMRHEVEVKGGKERLSLIHAGEGNLLVLRSITDSLVIHPLTKCDVAAGSRTTKYLASTTVDQLANAYSVIFPQLRQYLHSVS